MKKYVKRIGAVAAAMVMSTAAITASAATVALENADSAEKWITQVIVADPTTPTGWDIVGTTDEAGSPAAVYSQAFSGADEQTIIAMMIKKMNEGAVLPDAYAGVAAATDLQLDVALSGLTITGAYTGEVDAAGLYAIKASETGYSYKNMAVYLEFGGVSTSTITAKKAPITTTKTNTGAIADNAAGIGDTVPYEVTTTVPYISASAANKFFNVTDKLTGGTYVQDSVKVYLDDAEITADFTPVFTENQMTIDLISLINDGNKNANATVKITYDVVITGTTVSNTAEHAFTDQNGGTPAPSAVYTGDITLVKYNADKTETLAGAEFEVYDKDTDPDYAAPLKFKENAVGDYTFDPLGTDDATTTTVTTDAEGKLNVEGLDVGNYHFKETKAPAGYSINEDGADAELTFEGEKAVKAFASNADITDTKLSALPSTGGIGTYAFTIVGVVVMAVMASLFFIKRRREAE